MNGKDPNTRDDEVDKNVDPMFKRRMVTAAGAGAEPMGIQKWWATSHYWRSKSCTSTTRCELHNRAPEQRNNVEPWCAHCNSEYWARQRNGR